MSFIWSWNSMGDIERKRSPILQIGWQVHVFHVWGTPDQGPRSRVMANKLGIEAVFCPRAAAPGGLVCAHQISYSGHPDDACAIQSATAGRLCPKNPPLLAVLCVYAYCLLAKAGYIIDAHSEAFLARGWTITAPLDKAVPGAAGDRHAHHQRAPGTIRSLGGTRSDHSRCADHIHCGRSLPCRRQIQCSLD